MGGTCASPTTTLRISLSDTNPTSGSAEDNDAAWMLKLADAATQLKKAARRANGAVPDPNDYNVLIVTPDTKKGVATIDMDFVIHGVDYSDLSDGRKGAFLRSFADGVRSGIDFQTGGAFYPDIHSVVNDIRVVFSPDDTRGSVRVQARIPAPVKENAGDTALAVEGLMVHLTSNMHVALKNNLDTQLQQVDGIKFVSTWTSPNIHVI